MRLPICGRAAARCLCLSLTPDTGRGPQILKSQSVRRVRPLIALRSMLSRADLNKLLTTSEKCTVRAFRPHKTSAPVVVVEKAGSPHPLAVLKLRPREEAEREVTNSLLSEMLFPKLSPLCAPCILVDFTTKTTQSSVISSGRSVTVP